MADPSRRALPQVPVAETRRISDIYKPITTAAYGTPVPLVIGQQRVPTNLVRDGRNAATTNQVIVPSPKRGLVIYGVCEAPAASISLEYTNDKGTKAPIADPLTSVTISLPLVTLALPGQSDKTTSPDSLSFEVSSDINVSGNGQGTYQISQTDGTSVLNEDSVGLPANFVSDFHICTTGTGSTAVQWLVRFDRTANTISVRSRTVGGTWSADSILCSGSVNSAIRPVSAAMVQPRIAAAGTLVHVVWSVLDNTGSPIQIAHVWSANSGTSWSAGQSLSQATRANTTGVWKLAIALHPSGDVWTSFQRRANGGDGTVLSNNPSKGVVVGFLPSSATTSTAWVVPTSAISDTTNHDMVNITNELFVFDFSNLPKLGAYTPYRLRAPSILPLGSGKALLSAVFVPNNGAMQCQLVTVPIIADTEVHYDLPSGAFIWGSFTMYKNITGIDWLQVNGFPALPLDYTPSVAYDALNDASTQIFASDSSGGFGVLVLSKSLAFEGATPVRTAENHSIEGTWKLPFGSWNGTTFSWTVGTGACWSAQGWNASAFNNGNGQINIALGAPAGPFSSYTGTYSGPIDYRTDTICLQVLSPGGSVAQPVFTYTPETQADNALMYQFWAQNGAILTSIREDENLDGTYTVGIQEVIQGTGNGDVLPSVIAQRLVGNDLRGLNIANVVFDSVTWPIFDNYCKAMGIAFSIALTSQQAAWPLACDVIESANAIVYRSGGKIKILVYETASITANGATYTPLAEHSSWCATIPPEDLKDGIQYSGQAMDQAWNSLTVNWLNRARAYAAEPIQIDDAGSIARKNRIPGSAQDWNWICVPTTAMVCAWLKMRQQQRTGRIYKFGLSQKYMLLEPGDIILISHPSLAVAGYTARTVRIISIEEGDADWRDIEAEDVVVSTTTVTPPIGGTGSTGSSIISVTPVNLPIIFVALIGGLLQIFALLSWAPGGRGCNVWQSWDGVAYALVGSCDTPSPTGHLVQDMILLRARPGQRVRPGLKVHVSDFATGDYSESSVMPPYPSWGDWLAGNPGALLWVDGELMAYALEQDNGVQAATSMLRRGLYGTTTGPHSILSRCGAVTDAAWTMAVPPGRNGQTCYFRFPAYGEDVNAVATYTVGIPA
jgi:hypothetical protein